MLIIKEQSVLNPVMKKNHCRPVKYDWSAMIFLKLKLKIGKKNDENSTA